MAKAKSSTPCKCKKQECEECPEWIFTFADLVMLMMGFFVILWVLKPSPGKNNSDPTANDDWISVAAAVREAFGYLPDPHSSDPVDLHMLLKKLHTINPTKGPVDGGRARMEKKGIEGIDAEVQSIRDGKIATVGGKLLFDQGQIALTPETTKALDQVAAHIRGHYNIVVIKGHTSLDDLPDGAAPQQQMEFSLRRAQVVADYLASHGVDPQILRVQGCSTFEPVVQRAYTPEARALNRRVEIEVTSVLVGERQGTESHSAGTASTPTAKSQG